VSDEIYGRLLLDAPDDAEPPSVAGLHGLRERTIIVDGFSKTYAMTGWRLGFAVVPASLVRTFELLAVNAHTCVPAFVQRAGLAALTGAQHAVRGYRAELRRRRDRVVAALNGIPGVRCECPAAGFYAFPDVRGALPPGGSSRALADALLEERHVALLDGAAFGPGGDGHLRLSFAASQGVLDEALRRIERHLADTPPVAARLARVYA
jgi:aspartate/methionine/tyrosine aminotransferase